MDRSGKYSLALSGTLLLTLSAQSLLLATETQVSIFSTLPAWMADLLGAAFYFLGIFLAASVLLGYSKAAQTWVFLSTSISLIVIGREYIQVNYIAEGAVTLSMALAFLLCNWLTPKRHWMIETMQWTNLVIGAGLFIRPNLFTTVSVYTHIETNLAVFAILLLFSGLFSLLAGWFSSTPDTRMGIFLAIPWVLWGMMFILPLHLLNLGVAVSVILGLVLSEIIPWQKLVLFEAAAIGRRFFRLIIAGQVVALALVIWILRLGEANLSIPAEQLTSVRGIALLSFNMLCLVGIFVIASVNLSINGFFSSLNATPVIEPEPDEKPIGLRQRLVNSFLEPFDTSQKFFRGYFLLRDEYETLHARQLSGEKHRMAQLNLLHQLNLELESILDPPVSAQLTANAIFNAIGGTLTVVMQYDQEHDDLITLATSGPQSSSIPPGFRQKTTQGLIGRAARLRRTQLVSDTRHDAAYSHIQNQDCLSEIVVPLLYHNRLRGVIIVDSDEPNIFNDSDIRTIETVSLQLVTAWERSDHDQRLTNLISAGVTLSTTLDLDGLIKEIAEVARQTLDARFVFVALTEKGGRVTRTAHTGHAPTLLGILNSEPGRNSLVQAVIGGVSTFRLRDVRRRFASTPTGSNELRSLLAAPIRLRQSSIGAILSFGKFGNLSFSENDESLVSLLATQAAAAIETTWLYQELRAMLSTATQLYQLSIRVIQSEQLTDAAAAIAETAYQLSKGTLAGIVLTTVEKTIEVKVQIDTNGLHPGAGHPMDLIHQALDSGQTIIHSGANRAARICIPLQTPRGQYGALWVQIPEEYWRNARITDNLHTLANQAALALERSRLLVVTRKQAEEIKAAYHELETTYDQTLIALSSALDARDRETEGHSLRVAQIAHHLGKRLGLSQEQAKALGRGSILHDIGKIGISDSILLKPGTLSEIEWESMRTHPDVGARIIEGIPFLQDAIPVIRFHQERWDGSGYPLGLKGEEIPLLARIFSVVDAFDALTNDRPYRKKTSLGDAMKHLKNDAGTLFDPEIVAEFENMVKEGLITTLAS
jgi:HD-GYP domain-containing protein (c-di-GMP phosphodiesterase class II)/putative methionine-R-sulfoxide reductase with GAF domain